MWIPGLRVRYAIPGAYIGQHCAPAIFEVSRPFLAILIFRQLRCEAAFLAVNTVCTISGAHRCELPTVSVPISLCTCYALSGTDAVYDATKIRADTAQHRP